MAVEIANVVHALGTLNCNNPPAITRGFGFAEGGITRLAQGQYEVALEIPLNVSQGMAVATLNEGDGMVAVTVRDFNTFGPANLLITMFDDAGAAADLGLLSLVVYRFPQAET